MCIPLAEMVAGRGQNNKSTVHVMSRSSDQCHEISIAQKAQAYQEGVGAAGPRRSCQIEQL